VDFVLLGDEWASCRNGTATLDTPCVRRLEIGTRSVLGNAPSYCMPTMLAASQRPRQPGLWPSSDLAMLLQYIVSLRMGGSQMR